MPFDSVEFEPIRVSLNKQHVSTNTIPKYIAQMSSEHIPWQTAWPMSTRVKTEGRISAVSLKDLSSYSWNGRNLFIYLFIHLFIYVCFFICLFSLSAGISQSIKRPATCYYGVRIPSEAREFSLLQTFRPFLVPIQPPLEWYRGIKW